MALITSDCDAMRSGYNVREVIPITLQLQQRGHRMAFNSARDLVPRCPFPGGLA